MMRTEDFCDDDQQQQQHKSSSSPGKRRNSNNAGDQKNDEDAAGGISRKMNTDSTTAASVSNIIKQLESKQHPFRAKSIYHHHQSSSSSSSSTTTTTKSNSSSNFQLPSSPSSYLLQNSTNHHHHQQQQESNDSEEDISSNSKNDQRNPAGGIQRIKEPGDGGDTPNSNNSNNSTNNKSSSSLTKGDGSGGEEGGGKKKKVVEPKPPPPPLPPPLPPGRRESGGTRNSITNTTTSRTEVGCSKKQDITTEMMMTSSKRSTWRKIEDRWVQQVVQEDSSTNNEATSSTSTTDLISSTKERPFSSSSTSERIGSPFCTLLRPGKVSFNNKPTIPQRHHSTASAASPLRPRPPPPAIPAKPSSSSSSSALVGLTRKYDPTCTISVVSSNSSVPSLSDEPDFDSDLEQNGYPPRTPAAAPADGGGDKDKNNENGGGDHDDHCSSSVPDTATASASAIPSTTTLSREQKAHRCAKEFLSSEKSYVRTLELLSEDFPKFMKSQTESGNRLSLEPDDVPSVVANSLHELRELHRILAADFQARIDNWDSHPHLADILLTKGPFLKMSIRFLQRKEELANQVLTACKRYPDFHRALTAFERAHFEGLHLVHKLDCVHQRLCRYPLLLCSYLKYLWPESEEFILAQKAKDFINGITLELEASLKDQDGTMLLCELYRRIVQQSRFEVIEPGRKLHKQGPILKYSRKERQSRHLILFNDVLLVCAPVVAGSNLLRVRHVFELRDPATDVSVAGDLLDEDPNRTGGWEFVLKGRHKSIIFIAESSVEGMAWVKAIQSAIGVSHRKSSDFTLPPLTPGPSSERGSMTFESPQQPQQSQYHQSMTTTVSLDLGKAAPIWTPDQRVTMCQYCNTCFTVIRRRRHHCRACGRVICDECSGKAPLEYLDFKDERVCPNCYAVLYERTKEGTYLEDVCVRTKLEPTHLLALYVAPKNRFNLDHHQGGGEYPVSSPGPSFYEENDEEDPVLVKGYLRLSRNGQQWKRYWTVFREMGLMEFYKAVNDRKCDWKLVLLGWQAQPVVDGGEEFVFRLSHSNQFKSTADRQVSPAVVSSSGSNQQEANMHYWLRADDAETMDRWLSALNSFFEKFES